MSHCAHSQLRDRGCGVDVLTYWRGSGGILRFSRSLGDLELPDLAPDLAPDLGPDLEPDDAVVVAAGCAAMVAVAAAEEMEAFMVGKSSTGALKSGTAAMIELLEPALMGLNAGSAKLLAGIGALRISSMLI
jgi:hypothetical protein